MSDIDRDPSILSQAREGLSRASLDYRVRAEHWADIVRDAPEDAGISDLERVAYGLTASELILEEVTGLSEYVRRCIGQPAAFSFETVPSLRMIGAVAEPGLIAAFGTSDMRHQGYIGIALTNAMRMSPVKGRLEDVDAEPQTITVITRTGSNLNADETIEPAAAALGVRVTEAQVKYAIGWKAVIESFGADSQPQITQWLTEQARLK